MIDYLVRLKTSQQFTTNTLTDMLITPDHQNEAMRYQSKYRKKCKQSNCNLSTVFAEIERKLILMHQTSVIITEYLCNHPIF